MGGGIDIFKFHLLKTTLFGNLVKSGGFNYKKVEKIQVGIAIFK